VVTVPLYAFADAPIAALAPNTSTVINTGALSTSNPFQVALDGFGNMYVGDYSEMNVTRIAAGGGTASLVTLGTPGGSVIKVDASGVASALVIPSNITPAISNPQGVGVDGMGNLYVVDTGHIRIVKITTAGVASVLNVSGLPNPSSLSSMLFGVTVDPSGNIYIPDWTNNRIVYVAVSGASLSFAGTKQDLKSTDSPKTATVTNLGNQVLVLASDPSYTADFSQASSNANPCTSTTNVGYSLRRYGGLHSTIGWQPDRQHHGNG
jgi:sugar lactone lactonase YvrE